MSNIASLPTDPAGGGSIGGNVQLSAVEQNNVISNMQASVNKQMGAGQQPNQPVELSQSTIAELVSGIQKMSNNGNTTLPSKDVPMTESDVTIDEAVKPNYVPATDNTDYIKDYISNDTILRDHEKAEVATKNVEDMYDELQTPILAAILYFMLQLPAVKKYETKFIPGLFNTDGNMNLYGVLFNSIIMCSILFIVKRVLNTV
jgi:hypothetical protein